MIPNLRSVKRQQFIRIHLFNNPKTKQQQQQLYFTPLEYHWRRHLPCEECDIEYHSFTPLLKRPKQLEIIPKKSATMTLAETFACSLRSISLGLVNSPWLKLARIAFSDLHPALSIPP